MSISRRKFLGFLSVVLSGFSTARIAKAAKPSPPRMVLGHQLHDDVSVSLLNTFVRSLALKSRKARGEAQMRFHQALLARERGGTASHKLGYLHKNYVETIESGRKAKGRENPNWS